MDFWRMWSGCMAVGAVLAAGCASTPDVSNTPAGPPLTKGPATELEDAAPVAPPPALDALPDPVVRDDPKSKRGNSPYVVFGKHYQVVESAAGYNREGDASWYGTKFHGRTTSSGETYNMYELTAAHRSLPIPTYVRVTNLDNGKSSVVRVNDRGPFHPERIIDLSYAAAVKLGFERTGTARVRVESLAGRSRDGETTRRARFFVDTGIFANSPSARIARAEVAELTAEDAFVASVEDAYAVRIGPFATFEAAARLQSLLVFADRPRPVILMELALSTERPGARPVAESGDRTQ